MTQPTTRRQAFALAAALTLTVLTGGAAVTGLRHGATQTSSATPIVQITHAPAQAPPHEVESD
jgi:hypothetical protein